MDTVIITGAIDEPAISVARRICELGMRVYALDKIIPETGLSADEFVPVVCDLTSPSEVLSAVEKILEKETRIAGVVIAKQFLKNDFFESISYEDILSTIASRLSSPLCVVRAALPSLIATRGHVIVISPDAGTPPRCALNAAVNSALEAFAGTLFEELRNTGVKTCRILLKNNDGAPDPAARFTTAPQSKIQPDIVADTVETVFRLRENNALTQIVLRPQATRETPHIPVSAEPKIRAIQAVQLPPKKHFPTEETPIPTPAYRRPDYAPKKGKIVAETPDDDFSDDYVDPELRYLVKQNSPQENRGNAQNNAQNAEVPRSQNGKKRRYKNHHKRHNPQNAQSQPADEQKPTKTPAENSPSQPTPTKDGNTQKPRRRHRKPRDSKTQNPNAKTPAKRAPQNQES